MQQEKIDEIEKFTEMFFKNLNCLSHWDKNIFFVENIPEQFENFVGKKGPYSLVFNSENLAEGRELISRGSFFLVAMSRFLSSRSKRTLLELNIDVDPVKEITERFVLANSKITDVRVEKRYDIITRFTFSTTFQYRNGKKQETNTIFVKGEKILPIDFSKYSLQETEKSLTRVGKLEAEYELAKKELQKLISSRSKIISKELKPLLDKEIQRIKDHFVQQLSEIEEAVFELEKQIAQTREKLVKTKEKEKAKLENRLSQLNKDLSQKQIEQDEKIGHLKKEQEIVMEDEKYKHSLSVTNKLINTSIIFVPSFFFNSKIQSANSASNVQFEFDPIQKHMPPVKLSNGKETYSFYLCAGGSLCEKKDLVECFEDGKLYCNNLMTICDHSKKRVYQKNTRRCAVTAKIYGKSYIKKDELTGKDVYVNLLERCPATNLLTAKENLKPCPNCKTRVVEKAIRKKFEDGKVITVCGCCGR